MLPTFLGIGAPKAATTWIHKCLAEHPDVFMAKEKEVNFFAYLEASIDHRLPEYEAFFKEAAGQRAVGEISTNYLASPTAAARVRAHLPNARIFVALRNPYDQVNSHYWHLHRQNFHTFDVQRAPTNLREAVERSPALMVEPARYFTHLSRWFDLFPREQIHVILYDDVAQDPLGVLRHLFKFIGVDDTFVPGSLAERGSDVRRGVSPRSPAADRVHANLYNWLNRYVYHRMKRIIGGQRADAIKDLLRVRQTLETLFYRTGYEPLSRADRKMLEGVFEGEIRNLETLADLDLSRWSDPGS